MSEESRVLEKYLKSVYPFGFRVHHFNLLDSTQKQARRLAESGEPEGSLVVARRQTSGYGRKGDFWHSGPGGLWFTLILRPKFGPERCEEFSLACAKAVMQALKIQLPNQKFEFKPPNDVLADVSSGQLKKVCGILLEGSIFSSFPSPPSGGRGRHVPPELPSSLSSAKGQGEGELPHSQYAWLLLGIGLNVNNELPSELQDFAITLENLKGRPVPRMPLLREIMIQLSQTYKMIA